MSAVPRSSSGSGAVPDSPDDASCDAVATSDAGAAEIWATIQAIYAADTARSPQRDRSTGVWRRRHRSWRIVHNHEDLFLARA